MILPIRKTTTASRFKRKKAKDQNKK